MKFSSWPRNPMGRRTRSPRRNLPGRRLRLQAERLEDRLMLAQVTWIGGSGDWNSGLNWSNGAGPGPADDAVIDMAGASITYSAGAHSIQSLTINNPFMLSGGTLIISGKLVQQNANTVTMTGGTLRGATVVGEGGAVLVASGGTLDGVTLGATVGGVPTAATVQGNGGAFFVTGGLAFANGSLVDLGNQMTLTGEQTLDGDGEIRFRGGQSSIAGIGQATFGAGLTIHRADASSSVIAIGNGGGITNRGTIRADAGGQIRVFSNLGSASFANAAGGVLAADGGTLSLATDWSNAGRIVVNDSTLNLGGRFTTDGIGTIARTGGAINLTGLLDNTGRTLALDDATGSWNLDATGSLHRGSLVTSGGAVLLAGTAAGQGGTLDGVTLGGTVGGVAASATVQGNAAAFFVTGGLTFANGSLVDLDNGMVLLGGQTLGGDGEIRFRGPVAGISNSDQTTFGPGLTIHRADANVSVINIVGGGITNQATIRADAGGEIRVSGSNPGASFTNAAVGVLAADGGTLSLATDWSNAGRIVVNDSTLNLGGRFTTDGIGTIARTGGAINLTGLLDNTGRTLALDDATGSWNLATGSPEVRGGNLVTSQGAEIVVTHDSGKLNGVTLGGTVGGLPASAIVQALSGFTVTGGLTFANGSLLDLDTGIVLVGDQTLGGDGEIRYLGGATGIRNFDRTTLGPGLTIHGAEGSSGDIFLVGGSITNRGTIRADRDSLIRVHGNSGTTFTNAVDGVLTTDGGTLLIDSTTNVVAGTLTGGIWQALGGGTLRITGADISTNAAAITLDGIGASITRDSVGTNALANLAANAAGGNLTLRKGANLSTSGSFTNSGSLTLGPESTFAMGGDYLTASDTTIDGSLVAGTVTVAQTGTLAGSGTVAANLVNNGQVRPGTSTGTLSVNGRYTQGGTGRLDIDLGGTSAGSQYDRLNISGSATLDGTLAVHLVNGFGPAIGQRFEVMTFAGSNGAFSTVTGLSQGRFPLFSLAVNPADVELDALSNGTDLAFDAFDGATFPQTAAPGQDVTLTYTVKNLSAVPAMGDWIDSVYLSTDGTLDPADALLARVEHRGGAAETGSYSETVTAALPPLANGAYHVIILSDSRGLVSDPNRANNRGVSAAAIAVTVPVLTLGTPLKGAIDNGRDLYYRLVVAPGQDVTITADLTVPQAVDAYLRYRDVPDRSNFDEATTSGELHPRLMLSSTEGGSYYILLHGREGAAGGTSFTLKAEPAAFEIVRLNPLRGSNKGDATIDLLGSKFTRQTQVSLLSSGGSTHNATRVEFVDSNHLSATFDLKGFNIGIYQVQAKDAGETATSADTFLVTDIAPGRLIFDLDAPTIVRVGADIAVALRVENPTDSNVRVPFLLLDASNVKPGSETQEFFGGPNLPKILPPHYKGGVIIPPYKPDPKGAGVESDFNLNIINPTEVTMNWDARKENLRPRAIPADAWDAIWANLRPQLGDTLEDFYALLSGDFRAFGRSLGVEIRNVARLFAFELRMANDLPALPVPAGGLDLAFPAPGLPLAFGRSFGASIAGRYYVGRLGRGWVDNLDISASADANGLVTIRQGSNLRLFAPMPDGSYMGVPGDFATLTLSGGAFRLRETGGEVTAFRTDGLLDYIQDTNNNRLTVGYSGSRLTSLTHTNGSALTFHYNAQGRIDQVTDPAGRVASYAYDASGEHLQSVTTTAGTTAYDYTPESSGPHAHAITSISYPDGTHLFFDYDNHGRLVGQQQDGGANAISFTYDIGFYRATDALGNSTYIFYDDVGRTAFRVDGVGPKADDGGPVTRTGYDDLTNRVAQIKPPGSNPVTFGYDGRGNLTQITNPQGQAQHYSYEPSLNRLISWKDALGHETTYDQDPKGNPLTTTYVDGSSEQYTYDAQGNPVSVVNRLGKSVSETYDRNGLVKSKNFADGTHLDYDYDAHGNMISATAPAGATTMEYDLADRMTKITYPDGRFLEFTYDAGGRRIRTVDQGGFTINYRYDAVGRLAELTDGLGQRIVAYDYDAAGRLARESRGNGTFTTYEYDRLGQVMHLVNSAADATVLSQFDYTYDLLGRRESMTTLEGTTTYGYDAASRLTSVTLPGPRTITYKYDAAGNRQVVTDDGAATAYTTNALNQYVTVGGVGLTYDAGGNLTAAGGSISYSYDVQGRLQSAITPQGTWTYEYDALGNRIASTHDGIRTEYLIDPTGLGDVVGEYDGAGNLEAHYVHGLGLASRVDAMNQSDYYQFDAVGNTAQLTGPDGTVLNSYSYLPFGESLSASESVANPFTFVGQLGVTREGNGLDFMRSRWYDAAHGRFTQPDPIGFAGGTNLYAYVSDNPALSVDPSGLAPAFDPLKAINYVIEAFDSANPTMGDLVANLMAETANAARLPLPETVPSNLTPGGVAAYTNSLNAPQPAASVAEVQSVVAAQRAEAAAGVARVAGETAGLGKAGGLAVGIAVVESAAAVVVAGIVIAEAIEYSERGELPPGVFDALTTKYLSNDILFDQLMHFAYGSNPVGAGIVGIKNLVKLFASTTQTELSRDPNDITGPEGFGPEQFVVPESPLSYRIDFQNKPDALGPAEEVVVTQDLDPNLDLDTFELGDFGFGDLTVTVPAGRQFYSTRLDLRSTRGVFVDVTAQLDRASRRATWTFAALDPETLDLPISPFVGFLPPDKVAPEGEGFVSFTARARPDLPTGTHINAQATIVFDTNDPIDTKVWVNTLDVAPPASSVNALPATTTIPSLTVSWSGSDEAGLGSGIATFDVFVSDNGGPYMLWQHDVTGTSAAFDGIVGHTYRFYSMATDRVGHDETAPAAPDAMTTIVAAHITVSVDAVEWGSQSIALEMSSDGVRLVPTGRRTDLPWFHVDRIDVSLSEAAAVNPGDVSVTGSAGGDYGPVTISGSGTRRVVITLARAISTPDRVTLTIGNDRISTFQGRLDVLPGDVNDDGVVNTTDGVLILYNQTPAHAYQASGDLNGDGAVNNADFTLARSRIGNALSALPAATASARLSPALVDAVLGTINQDDFPEPSTSGLASIRISNVNTARKKGASSSITGR